MSFGINDMPAFSDVSDVRVQSLKVLEEASELCEAGKKYSGYLEEFDKTDECCYGESLRTAMINEFADVAQTLVNFAACFDITDAEISQAVRRCVERNRERGRY